jgi:hypothetical protein
MGEAKGKAGEGKQPRPVVKPVIKTNVLRDLKEERVRRDAQDLSRGTAKTIAHIDEVAKLGNQVFKQRNDLFDAATTGNDPEINHMARKKAAVSIVPKKGPEMECKGGVCRIVRKKKK